MICLVIDLITAIRYPIRRRRDDQSERARRRRSRPHAARPRRRLRSGMGRNSVVGSTADSAYAKNDRVSRKHREKHVCTCVGKKRMMVVEYSANFMAASSVPLPTLINNPIPGGRAFRSRRQPIHGGAVKVSGRLVHQTVGAHAALCDVCDLDTHVVAAVTGMWAV
jgi:hypothetical protein